MMFLFTLFVNFSFFVNFYFFKTNKEILMMFLFTFFINFSNNNLGENLKTNKEILTDDNLFNAFHKIFKIDFDVET